MGLKKSLKKIGKVVAKPYSLVASAGLQAAGIRNEKKLAGLGIGKSSRKLGKKLAPVVQAGAVVAGGFLAAPAVAGAGKAALLAKGGFLAKGATFGKTLWANKGMILGRGRGTVAEDVSAPPPVPPVYETEPPEPQAGGLGAAMDVLNVVPRVQTLGAGLVKEKAEELTESATERLSSRARDFFGLGNAGGEGPSPMLNTVSDSPVVAASAAPGGKAALALAGLGLAWFLLPKLFKRG